jgi:Glycosyltransferase
MRIVVTGTRGIPNVLGGVEKHCEELYPRIVKLGCDVTLIRRSCHVSDQLKEYKGIKLKTIYTPKRKSLEAFFHTFRAVILAKRMKADILHIHAIGPSLFVPLARRLGLRVVVTHHGPDYDRQKWNKFAKRMLKLGERYAATQANELIVISNVINEIVRTKYGRKDAHLIFNGVDSPTLSTGTDYIQKWGLDKGKYILAAGRFVPEKGFDLLIEAFSSLKRKDIQLVLAGDADHETDYSRNLKKKAKEQGIILTGFISGEPLNELFSHARLFVLPSFHEGLPIVLLEAMSYGLDVLVSDIPANVEVNLPPDSYFTCGNIPDLTEKLNKKMFETSVLPRKYAMEKYEWDEIAKEVVAVYRNALKK